MFEDNLAIIIQALDNVGDTFGGSTRVALKAVAKEARRLRKWDEDQRIRAQIQEAKEHRAALKAQGIPHPDDDIPF